MNRNSLQEAIDVVNGFESKLTQPNITNYKTYITKFLLSNIPETVDITEFLHKMLERSQQFTSSSIKSKLFTLTETHIQLKVEFKTVNMIQTIKNSIVVVPARRNWEDLIGIVEED